MNESEFDTQFKTNVVCPHCGQVHYGCEIEFNSNGIKIMNCKKCEKEFKAVKIEMVEYATYKTVCF